MCFPRDASHTLVEWLYFHEASLRRMMDNIFSDCGRRNGFLSPSSFVRRPVSMCCVRASFPAHSEPNRSILFDVFGGWRTISAHGFWMRSKGISLSRFFSGENSSKGAARLFCDWSFDSLNISGEKGDEGNFDYIRACQSTFTHQKPPTSSSSTIGSLIS